MSIFSQNIDRCAVYVDLIDTFVTCVENLPETRHPPSVDVDREMFDSKGGQNLNPASEEIILTVAEVAIRLVPGRTQIR